MSRQSALPLIYAQFPEPASGPVESHECSHLMLEGRPFNDQGPEPCGQPATRMVLIGNTGYKIRRYRCAEHLPKLLQSLRLTFGDREPFYTVHDLDLTPNTTKESGDAHS